MGKVKAWASEGHVGSAWRSGGHTDWSTSRALTHKHTPDARPTLLVRAVAGTGRTSCVGSRCVVVVVCVIRRSLRCSVVVFVVVCVVVVLQYIRENRGTRRCSKIFVDVRKSDVLLNFHVEKHTDIIRRRHTMA